MRRFAVVFLVLLLLLSGCGPEQAGAPSTPVATPSTPSAVLPSAPVPSSTLVPRPTPAPDPIPDGPFAALLSGDTSAILDGEDRAHVDWTIEHLTSSEFNPIYEIGPGWSYTLLDLDGDGEDELFLRPADARYTHFVFDAVPGGLRLLDQKTVGMYYWFDPLTDGRLLETLHYDGAYTYTLYRLDSDGWLLHDGPTWTYRYEDRLYYTGTEPESPAWSRDGADLTEEEFNDLFQREVADLLVSDWSAAVIPSPLDVAAGVYAPLLHGDFSALDDDRRVYIEKVFSCNFSWEYALADLDGDGADELCVRMVGAPGICRVFHEEGGRFQCWYLQDDATYSFDLLSDGAALSTYPDGAYNRYVVWAFSRDGDYTRREEADNWYYSEYDHVWNHNGQSAAGEEFLRFEASLEERRVPYWGAVPFE